MKKVTIKDVAARSGVSISTVSQYLNGRYNYMAEGTKERIKEAVRDLNYQPNFMARNLKNSSTKTIGIIVSNILHHFAVSLTRRIEDYCDANGYSLIICNADDDPVKEGKYINNLISKQVDGLIIMPTTENDELYKRMANQRFPVVFIDRFMDDVDVPVFKLNNSHAVETAYKYLQDKGVGRFCYISVADRLNLTPRVERRNQFLKRSDANKHFEHQVIRDSNDLLAERISLEFNDAHNNGIILANDFALMAFLNFVSESGINIRDRNHIVAIDNPPLADVYQPRFTTIAQPIEEIASNAYQTLMKQIEDQEEPEQKISEFKGTLIER